VIGWVLVVLAMLVLADGAMACSCAPQAPAEALEESDAAVVARLVKVLPQGRLHADYRYEVRQVYRGNGIDKGQMLSVRSGRRAATCALPRRLDHVYGLFLAHRQGKWFGGICSVVEPRRLRHAAENQPADSARASVQPVLCG
jgi:hypothetical protein